MIKFDKNEFLKPQIYSTLDEYETRCSVTKEIIEEIKQLQQENKILKENAEHNDKVVDKVNWENMLLKKENEKQKDNWNKLKGCLKDVMDSSNDDDKEFVETILNIMQEIERGSDE